MAKRKSKRKISIKKYLNKVLVHIIKRFLQTSRRRHRIGKEPKVTESKMSHAVNSALSQLPAKITVNSASDTNLVKEQQRGIPTAQEEVNKPKPPSPPPRKPLPQLMPPPSANVNNNNAEARGLIPVTPKHKSITIPGATPRKLTFDNDGNAVSIKNKRSGYEIKMSEAKAQEIFEDHKNAGKLRHEASLSKDAEEKALLEAKAARMEREAAEKAKQASDKRLEKEIQRSREEEIAKKQSYMRYDMVKDVYKFATDNKINGLEPKKITRTDQYLRELNTIPAFKQYFEDLDMPETKLSKSQRDKFEAQTKLEILHFIDPKQEGNGTKNKSNKIDMEGPLSNHDIDNMMGEKKDFIGTFALDTLPKFSESDAESYNFIVNTQPMTNPTVGHWIAMRVTPDVVEYYDPLGLRPSPQMKTALKRAIGFNGKRQFKINRMQDQSITSSNCGWFAMRFLDKRNAGSKWVDATGFNKLGEAQIKKYKLKYKDFVNV